MEKQKTKQQKQFFTLWNTRLPQTVMCVVGFHFSFSTTHVGFEAAKTFSIKFSEHFRLCNHIMINSFSLTFILKPACPIKPWSYTAMTSNDCLVTSDPPWLFRTIHEIHETFHGRYFCSYLLVGPKLMQGAYDVRSLAKASSIIQFSLCRH